MGWLGFVGLAHIEIKVWRIAAVLVFADDFYVTTYFRCSLLLASIT